MSNSIYLMNVYAFGPNQNELTAKAYRHSGGQ